MITLYIDWDNHKVYRESDLSQMKEDYINQLLCGDLDFFDNYLNDFYTPADIYHMKDNEKQYIFDDYVEGHFSEYLETYFEKIEYKTN